jgi:uncharacterized C2H2 Zn-finger protein
MSQQYKCNICGQVFGSGTDLEAHKAAAHGENAPQQNPNLTEEQKRLDKQAQEDAERRQSGR